MDARSMRGLFCLFLFHLTIGSLSGSVNSSTTTRDSTRPELTGRNTPSLATAVVNSQVLTIFNYQDNQIYVYSALSNENENRINPQRWVFYFVPIMLPAVSNDPSYPWAFIRNNEVHVRLMLSNREVEDLARISIKKKFDSMVNQYALYWDVAPLMIDSLVAYVVRGTNLPVEGVHPYKAIHPNQLYMLFRFQCSSSRLAYEILGKIMDGQYEIEIAFHFAGFKQISSNIISVSSDQLNSVLSKTTADGGTRSAQFIHRQQASAFVGKYLTNVKKMIYLENDRTNHSTLTANLEDQFISLMERAMDHAEEVKLNANFYNQIWSGNDLNPDLITNQLNKLFIYNKTGTGKNNFSDTFFTADQKYAQSLSSSSSMNVGLWFPPIGVMLGGSGSSATSSSNSFSSSNKLTFAATDIRNSLEKNRIEAEWTGEKWIVKSFSVFKINDIADYLQVGIISRQLIVERTSGAIIRTVSANHKALIGTTSSSILSEITQMVPPGVILLWNGTLHTVPKGWAVCDGTQGTPDLRDKFIIGSGFNAQNAPHQMGGSASVLPTIRINGTKLTVAQMPRHAHQTKTGPEDKPQIYYDTSAPHQTILGQVWGVSRYLNTKAINSCDACQHTHQILPEGDDEPHTHNAEITAIPTVPPFMALLYIMKL